MGNTRLAIGWMKIVSQDFLRHRAAGSKVLSTVHEQLRVRQWDQSGFLAQRGIAGQARALPRYTRVEMPSPMAITRDHLANAHTFENNS